MNLGFPDAAGEVLRVCFPRHIANTQLLIGCGIAVDGREAVKGNGNPLERIFQLESHS